MINLGMTDALAGQAPLVSGDMTLTPTDFGPLTLVLPYRGQAQAASAALHGDIGVGLPNPLRSDIEGKARVTWFGKEAWLVSGVAVTADLSAHAAVSDQTDGWAVVTLDGVGAEDVLARLVPVDLRAVAFGVGAACRTDLGHVPVGVIRVAQNRFAILCFRSMAQTMWHDLATALGAVVARQAG